MTSDGLRRSCRVSKEIPILLVGSDIEGKVFSEQTKTVLLSRFGAGIISGYKLAAEQELILRRLDTNQETEVRLVGQLGSHAGSYTYGVSFLGPLADFWGIEFPAASESEIQQRRLLLQCSSCTSREIVEQSDLEADVYRVNEGIVRFCKKCGSSTVWKGVAGASATELAEAELASSPQPADPPASAPLQAAPAPPQQASPENRRKHIRTKVNFQACVRSFAFGDDVVACEDMSRGGLGFKSRKRYMENANVEIAAPYSLGAPCIFVTARIVYVLELQQERLFRCGVAYQEKSKAR